MSDILNIFKNAWMSKNFHFVSELYHQDILGIMELILFSPKFKIDANYL